VDPRARRQVRRHPRPHELHLGEDPAQVGRRTFEEGKIFRGSAPSCAGATTRTWSPTSGR
jgi:hypothetical protein